MNGSAANALLNTKDSIGYVNIYTRIPDSLINKVINDVEPITPYLYFSNDDYTNRVLSEIEKGSYVSRDIFTDRFGYNLKIDCLSTGSKILIAVKQLQDRIIDATELGNNCLDLLLHVGSGNILFKRSNIEFSEDIECNITLNGTPVSSVSELNYLISLEE